MGWFFCAESKDELVETIRKDLRGAGFAILGESLRGSRLWVAVNRPIYIKEADTWVNENFIVLYLLSKSKDSSWPWGYKDMDEGMHPYYYDCPLRLLDATAPEEGKEESTWRKAVREHHARKRARPKPEAGMVVTYGREKYRLNYPIAPRRGWDVTRVRDGMNFRLKAKQLSAALRQEV